MGPERLAGWNLIIQVKIRLKCGSFWDDEMFWNQIVMIATNPCKHKCSSTEDGVMS